MRKEIKLTKHQVREILSVSSRKSPKKKTHKLLNIASLELFNLNNQNTYDKMCTLSEKKNELPNNVKKFIFSDKFVQNHETNVPMSPRKVKIEENCLIDMNVSKDSMNILEMIQPQTSCELCENCFYKCINCNMASLYIHNNSFESQRFNLDDSFRGMKDKSFEKILINLDQHNKYEDNADYKGIADKSFEKTFLNPDHNILEDITSFKGCTDKSFEKTLLNLDYNIPHNNTLDNFDRILANEEQCMFFSYQ